MKHRFAAGFLALLTCVPLAAQRLPRFVFPVRYDLVITPDLASETFNGEETIAVTVEQPISSIEINASDIAFDGVTVTSGRDMQTATVTLNKDNERATLSLQRPLDVGAATIHISYRGKLNKQLRGFYIGEANGRKYVASQMEAVDARYAFPSFDEPELKAQFAITVVIDDNLKAFSNGAVESETPGPAPGKRTVRFALTPRMSTYLVALVVGDFDCLSEDVDGIQTRVCSSPDRVQFGKFALEENKNLLRYFNRYYSIPYPFVKLDHLGVADFAAGAMENVGAIIYRERLLVTEPKTASPQQRKSTSSVIAHEIAHQWFGDLVTMKWWDDIWLNEGFASWMEGKAVAEIHPEWNVAMGDLEETNRPLNADVLNTTRAIHHPVETRDEIDQMFDSIAYGKTAALLKMLENYSGPEKFREGINHYISRHAYGNASAGDFAAALSLISGQNIGEVLESYVKQPGVPLVTIDSRCEGDETVVDLKQERFFVRRDRQAASDQLWIIPVCARAGRERECMLLRERSKTFRTPGCHAPLFANVDGQGYYLTAYAPDDRKALVARVGALSPEERFVFLRDTWFLSRAGLRPVGDYLDLAEAYANETERATIAQLLGNLETVERYVVSDAQLPQFQAWLSRLLAPAARRIGWKESPGDSDEIRQLRATLLNMLAESAADPAARKLARDLASQFLTDPATVSPAMASRSLQAAAIEGDVRLYEAYLRAYRAAKNPNVKYQLLSALASFRDPKLLQRTLELAISDEVRSQDAGRVIGDVLRNRAGGEIGWTFLKQNWEAIYKKIPPGGAGFIAASAASVCTLARRDELREFMKEHNVRDATRSTASAAERITSCVEFRDLQRQNLSSWIKSKAVIPSRADGSG